MSRQPKTHQAVSGKNSPHLAGSYKRLLWPTRMRIIGCVEPGAWQQPRDFATPAPPRNGFRNAEISHMEGSRRKHWEKW
ncbi:hypothetical protein [Cribrihabitans pelagius]|uniref:hypothetical protein n=1 Tax=Cribrihabitans pelagius TaxID=1765746 RepID=UPI003B593367